MIRLLFAKATNNLYTNYEYESGINGKSDFWIIFVFLLIGITLFIIYWGIKEILKYWNRNKQEKTETKEKRINFLVHELDSLKAKERRIRDKLDSIK